jgi:hypothetical protein
MDAEYISQALEISEEEAAVILQTVKDNQANAPEA